MGDGVPWATFRWTVVMASGDLRIELTTTEFFLVCAAVELDRVWHLAEVVDAKRKAKSDHRVLWKQLRGAAVGLQPQEAPGEMLDSDIYKRLKLDHVEFVRPLLRGEGGAMGRAVVKQLRGGQ